MRCDTGRRMSRKIFAVIEIDEDTARAQDDNYAPGEYFEREFGRLYDNGISLREWLVSDDDDVSAWAQYIDYLIEWGFKNSYNDDENTNPPKPLSFKAWRKQWN